MAITLTNPVRIGDLTNGITVDELEISAISVNLQPGHLADGNAVLSVVLVHPASGWQTTVTYRDPSVLEFWGSLDQAALKKTLIQPVWDKLMADGKLPQGTVDAVVPAAAAAAQAVASAAALKAAPAPPAIGAQSVIGGA